MREDVATYPPVAPGLPQRSVDEILAPHADLIRRIKLSYGSDQASFERHLLDLIRRYAGYVHLLPATPDNYFSAPAGLLRMGLETAFYALQATDGQIFSGRMSISQRHKLEPRWRHATFIAGLCGEIHCTLAHVIVSDQSGNQWPAYLQPLSEWLRAARVPRYFLRWIPNGPHTRALGVFALPQIIPSATLHYLAEGNTVVVPHMMACISGMPLQREPNILDQLVRHATALVIDRDLRASADRHGNAQTGAHLQRYVLDAMRGLIASHAAWTPNEAKSRVWFGRDGLYVVWPNAATEIFRLLDAERPVRGVAQCRHGDLQAARRRACAGHIQVPRSAPGNPGRGGRSRSPRRVFRHLEHLSSERHRPGRGRSSEFPEPPVRAA